jgi:RNA polymerase sigma factor (sigma-70 family)
MKHQHSDQQLIDMLKSKQEPHIVDAQVALYERFRDAIIAKSAKQGFTGDAAVDMAWDVVEAFSLRCQKAGFSPDNLEAYMMGICNMLLMAKSRKRKKERQIWASAETVPQHHSSEVAVDDFYHSQALSQAFDRCLPSLSEKCKKIIVLKYLPETEGHEKALSWEQIGTQLGYATGDSVKSASTNCKKQLKACLSKQFPHLFS